jgi:hypothetical protein
MNPSSMILFLLACDFEPAEPPPTLATSLAAMGAQQVDDATKKKADEYTGRYRFVGGTEEKGKVVRAIEKIVEQMNPFIRDMARDRLRKTNQVPEHVEIVRKNSRLLVKLGERRYVAPLDGSVVKVEGVTGETLRYRVDLGDSSLQQDFQGPRGQRHNRFDRDGETLELGVVVSSDKLPESLKYTLTFEAES